MSSGKGAEVVEAAKENHQVVEEEEEDEDEFAQMVGSLFRTRFIEGTDNMHS